MMEKDAFDDHDVDAMLMALADGELPDAQASELRARIARDPDLATRFALFAETRALIAPAPEAAPGQDRLAAFIRAQTPTGPRLTVIDGSGPAPRSSSAASAAASASRSVRASGSIWRPAWTPALAAGLALCVGGALGYAVGQGGEKAGDPAMLAVAGERSPAGRALAAALDTAASASEVAWSDPASGRSGAVAVIATHRLADGRFCREYDVTTAGAGAVSGVSCRGGDGWRAVLAVAKPAPGEGYATASGEGAAEQHLLGLGSAGALSEADEKAALASGWRSSAKP